MTSHTGSTRRSRDMLWRIGAVILLLIAVLLAVAQVWQLQQEGAALATAAPTIVATVQTPPPLENVTPTPAPETGALPPTTIEG